jgi:shikimate dehydrogenase
LTKLTGPYNVAGPFMAPLTNAARAKTTARRGAALRDFENVDRLAQPRTTPPRRGVQALFEALPRAGMRAALVGSGIRQSRTPGMHVAEGARLGLDYAYSLIDFDELGLPEPAIGDVLDLAEASRFAGLNVTHPFKERIVPLLDVLSAEAAAIGAVNTVTFTDGKSVGHNTDCWGFAESFRRDMAGAKLDRVLLLGAGGAGKAVARALAELGAGRIDIFDLDRDRSAELAANLTAWLGAGRAAVAQTVPEAALEAAGIVNTTPMGMAKYPGMPAPRDVLRPDLWVADIIYFPAETELLRAAVAAGCRTLPGKGMAVFQAVRAFELITGRRPDADEMFRHFEAASAATKSDSAD